MYLFAVFLMPKYTEFGLTSIMPCIKFAVVFFMLFWTPPPINIKIPKSQINNNDDKIKICTVLEEKAGWMMTLLLFSTTTRLLQAAPTSSTGTTGLNVRRVQLIFNVHDHNEVLWWTNYSLHFHCCVIVKSTDKQRWRNRGAIRQAISIENKLITANSYE